MSVSSPDLVAYDEAVTQYDPVIGIEVHVELGTKTKMFCSAEVEFGGEANTQVTPVSLGLPGALPVVNGKAVESAIKIGLALHCTIADSCRFARKNYFYPDVPKNFQTSQYDEPIAYDGYLDVELDDGEIFRVEIERAHMEEDAGKNTHVGGSTGRIHGAEYSLVDYNRAGIPLVEIVTKPIEGAGERAPEVARAYVQTLRDIFRALDVSEARMERGNVRADVNLSLRPTPESPLGTRTETKNVNSFRSIERAVRYEVERQAAILNAGKTVTQETRHWHEDTGITTAGREKSDAEDYRYFPEPDLVPVEPSREWVEELRASLPEMPAVKRRRLREEWGYSDIEMRDVVNAGALELIENTVAGGVSPAAARKWWMGELARFAKENDRELASVPVSPAQIAELQRLIDEKKINDKIGRQVLEGVLAGEGDPAEIVSARGLEIVSDDGPLLAAIDQVLADQPDIVEKVRSGNMGPVGAIIGAVMKATRGQADAGRVRELIIERIG
ncbi:Asp-tRNA(Asn)/Glu-tRNA(Gln) amidotransferase subunit GatB [Jonesia denitrificans]|uniref:Aspartyl/glutamyl-tRNA(Asn/Gln) amidotransferase subunit B n=1 Tax=Jonesia denitrificans (strain ATCC 14870 / DSM 20603 / BCRC 15368 / CIP 55.134 / JCM 11481 / NBRC 15587 / NCTC 10816 / Prevot 55134) TaxID=471856 RepID=C7QYX0_JONDD|nr:Asp-tRNA(Asn)/Glu-tRNA(Gln) amidotransferase subunit GatB [Jonesia denitrificans]ACV09359.1 glutamyl-tRNA(Gln) amidotransferase, B subunit [Jonesia denitrificans DSM 20603]ASE09389.1 Asp-tRNA(Asn)/Glu-tRNA(Gln) amidotransferase subunit GatB [Jonesia denitrificans]QXB43935.1 Asp-tRNA(Asn)/Glu-tRNA(Gln) amidotransferase subunit GatB [Jonesia denitrificans]SQH21639.1 Aspartyl/glutamyl-tRNA(Asn/Gln) amidotransferase subunit B [Jonesia denitrificans]